MTAISLGGWCHLDSSYTAEVIARAGFDWCCVDTQHGQVGRARLVPVLQALAAGGHTPLVRVAANRHDLIGQALDAGAGGVIVPQVSTVAQAEAAVRSCHYPPSGTRSWGPLRPKLETPAPMPRDLDLRAQCYPMIEDRAGLAAAADIAAVPGVAGLFVGPADLALDLYGDPTLANTERTIEAARPVAQACGALRIRSCVYSGPSATDISAWCAAGFTMLAVDSDSNMLIAAARSTVAQARAAVAQIAPSTPSPTRSGE